MSDVSGVPEEFGLEGPGSIAVSTRTEPEYRAVVESFLEKARAIRPVLRANQAQTEIDHKYSQEVHQYFIDTDMYKLFVPKKFGGYELDVSDFFLVVSEIARGCASTAWCFCLGSAHALQLGSYWSEEVQAELFGELGYVIAPNSGNSSGLSVVRVDGGYRISGTYRYASGSAYLTHFMPTMSLPDREGVFWFVIPRTDGIEVLNDWGAILGMKGSGSNSVKVTDVFVPDRFIVEDTFFLSSAGPTAGSIAHNNPLYAGTFEPFAVGEIAAITVGLGYAALDEYRRILTATKAPTPEGQRRPDADRRIDGANWQRSYGLALAKVDAAAAISTQTSRLYGTICRRSVEGVEPFSHEATYRLRATNMIVQDMIYEAVALMLRGTGSSALRDGQKMQRYYRDITTAVTRTNQLDFVAQSATQAMIHSDADRP